MILKDGRTGNFILAKRRHMAVPIKYCLPQMVSQRRARMVRVENFSWRKAFGGGDI